VNNDMLLESYKSARAEYSGIINELLGLERYALVTTGIVWSWAIGVEGNRPSAIVYYIPLILALFFFIKSIALYIQLSRSAVFLQRIECQEIGDENSWAKVINDIRRNHISPWKRPIHWISILYWMSMIISCFLAGYYMANDAC